jgi:hypothetical protein
MSQAAVTADACSRRLSEYQLQCSCLLADGADVISDIEHMAIRIALIEAGVSRAANLNRD